MHCQNQIPEAVPPFFGRQHGNDRQQRLPLSMRASVVVHKNGRQSSRRVLQRVDPISNNVPACFASAATKTVAVTHKNDQK